MIEELSAIDRAYFGKDRQKQLKAKIDEAIALLDTKPIDQGKFRAINYIRTKQKGQSAPSLPERQNA